MNGIAAQISVYPLKQASLIWSGQFPAAKAGKAEKRISLPYMASGPASKERFLRVFERWGFDVPGILVLRERICSI